MSNVIELRPKVRFYWKYGHWFCKEHKTWPCVECGSYHYEGCRCVFCQRRDKRSTG